MYNNIRLYKNIITNKSLTIKLSNLSSSLSNQSNVLTDSNQWLAISFYNFINYDIESLKSKINVIKSSLNQYDIYGTLLIAPEGYNGQMALKTTLLNEFKAVMSELLNDKDLRINIGSKLNNRQDIPYEKLLVKFKDQILTDRLDSKQIDWRESGYEITPENWHERLTNKSNSSIIIDCRNFYESSIGQFKGADHLNTTKFSESWEMIEKKLPELEKHEEVYIYCTGGIRCNKVGAYLTQKLGIKNVYRLQDGIIGYERWYNQNKVYNPQLDNLFEGKNYLFDNRRIISDNNNNDHINNS